MKNITPLIVVFIFALILCGSVFYGMGHTNGYNEGRAKSLPFINPMDFITSGINFPHMTIKNNSPQSVYIDSQDGEYDNYPLDSGSIMTTGKEKLIIKRKAQ